jgi:predicted patatin/cPLA2 family phospholipase
MTYNYLVNENYDLKNKLNQYENHFNQQNEVIYLDNNFNEIRDSISTNNQVGFNQAFDKLKTDIDTYTQNNYNAIITMKDQEIEKWKNEEKLRKEREDQELKALISAYDTSLSMGERENAELKKRLKELEGYF